MDEGLFGENWTSSNVDIGDFPGGPVGRTPPFQCRGYNARFPGQGTKIPSTMQCSQNIKKKNGDAENAPSFLKGPESQVQTP